MLSTEKLKLLLAEAATTEPSPDASSEELALLSAFAMFGPLTSRFTPEDAPTLDHAIEVLVPVLAALRSDGREPIELSVEPGDVYLGQLFEP